MLELAGKKPLIDEFLYWITERESVRKKKEAGEPKPWSSDPIFQKVYFCNVRREDDRVTRWIRENWSPDAIGWEDYEYGMVLARFLNWPYTLGDLVYDRHILTPPEIEEVLEATARKGRKVWGNAYVVTTHGLPMGKAQYLCRRVLPAAYEALGAGRWQGAYPYRPPVLAARHDDLRKLEGMGSFMSAQVLADLKNTKGHPLYEASDWWTWAAPGPGSMRGLAWLYDKRIPESQFMHHITMTREFVQCTLKIEISAQDIQNCLCEFDKYMRVKSKTGRSKRYYPGEA